MSGEWTRAWQHARRILCVRLDSLGDVLMCTPAFRALRDSLPGCRLALLTSPSGAAAARHVPELDGVLKLKAPWMKHDESMSESAMQACVANLAARRFDAAVIFTSWSQSPLPATMLCHLAGIPLRLASCRENPYQLLSHWVPEPEREGATRHEVQRQLDLIARIGCHTADSTLSFAVPAESERRVQTKMNPAAVIHDLLYETDAVSRALADVVFLEAKLVLGVATWRAYAAYAAVRGCGWKFYRAALASVARQQPVGDLGQEAQAE